MLGVLGSGQLGKMFAMAAARLGYRVHVYAPEHDAPAADVAYRQTIGSFDDEAAVAEFARSVDVVTLEFENISAAATEAAARFAPVRPGGRVLHTTQQRLREKGFLKAAGIPCTLRAASIETSHSKSTQPSRIAGAPPRVAWAASASATERTIDCPLPS